MHTYINLHIICKFTGICHWCLERNKLVAMKENKSGESISNYVFKDYFN